jgi:hypothetical protein
MTDYAGPYDQRLVLCDEHCNCGGSSWNGAVGYYNAKDVWGRHWRCLRCWPNEQPQPHRWHRVDYAGDEQ